MNFQFVKKSRLSIFWRKHSSGYTLIEILVTLTIVSVFFGFGYVSFRDFSRRQALLGVIKQIQGDLRLAQQQASSGQKPKSCTGNLSGIGFRLDSDSYQIEANCGGVGSPIIKGPVDLPQGIVISGLPSPNPIIFKVLGSGNNIVAGGTASIVVTQTGTGNSLTINVSSGGEIK